MSLFDRGGDMLTLIFLLVWRFGCLIDGTRDKFIMVVFGRFFLLLFLRVGISHKHIPHKNVGTEKYLGKCKKKSHYRDYLCLCSSRTH